MRTVGQCVPKHALGVYVIDETGAALPASIQIGAGAAIHTDGLGRLVIRCVLPQGLDLNVRAVFQVAYPDGAGRTALTEATLP